MTFWPQPLQVIVRSAYSFVIAVLYHTPQEKPVPLLRWLIRAYSDPGATVLDCTAGSGATGEACADEGRDFIGIELNAQHHATAAQRLGITP